MHLTNLEDADAFTTKDGSEIREVAGPVSLPSEQQSLAEATLPVGCATIPHFHRVSEELYFFTAGEGLMRLDDDERAVRPGDCVVIPPGAHHQITNTGTVPLKLLCCCAPPYSNDDTVLLEAPA